MSDFKIYTKTGDRGQTSLVDGHRLSKSALRIETYGTVDELNSHIGLLVAFTGTSEAQNIGFLKRIQNQLFNLGSFLACQEESVKARLHPVQPQFVEDIEKEIDRMTSALPPLSQFILPGGCLAASQAHVCRTVSRRAERLLVALSENTSIETNHLEILNRLSDYFFVLARALNQSAKLQDEVWIKE